MNFADSWETLDFAVVLGSVLIGGVVTYIYGTGNSTATYKPVEHLGSATKEAEKAKRGEQLMQKLKDFGASGAATTGLKGAFNIVRGEGTGVSKEDFIFIFHGRKKGGARAFFAHGMGEMRDNLVRLLENSTFTDQAGAKATIAEKFGNGLKRVHAGTPKVLEHIFDVIDKDNNGTIDQSEWNAICELVEGVSTEDKFDALFKKLFEVADLTNDGKISTADLSVFLNDFTALAFSLAEQALEVADKGLLEPALEVMVPAHFHKFLEDPDVSKHFGLGVEGSPDTYQRTSLRKSVWAKVVAETDGEESTVPAVGKELEIFVDQVVAQQQQAIGPSIGNIGNIKVQAAGLFEGLKTLMTKDTFVKKLGMMQKARTNARRSTQLNMREDTTMMDASIAMKGGVDARTFVSVASQMLADAQSLVSKVATSGADDAAKKITTSIQNDASFRAAQARSNRVLAARLFDVCDVDGNGVISWKEIDTLQAVARCVTEPKCSKAAGMSLFSFFDVDGNGELTADEVTHRVLAIKSLAIDVARCQLECAEIVTKAIVSTGLDKVVTDLTTVVKRDITSSPGFDMAIRLGNPQAVLISTAVKAASKITSAGGGIDADEALAIFKTVVQMQQQASNPYGY